MIEGVFALIGVVIGAVLQWAHLVWTERRDRAAHARYLAIRVVCILDKYVETCLSVVLDDGYLEGRPAGEDGIAEAQVETPPAPVFPDGLDWKSIDHTLMYRLLAFPRDIEIADRSVAGSAENAFPPDYEEYFEERQYQYATLGLAAFKITQEIRSKYEIPTQENEYWSASGRITEELRKIEALRRDRSARLRSAAPPASSPPPISAEPAV